MNQIPELLVQPNDQMIGTMNPNMNFVNQVPFQQMMPGDPNMVINGNVPMPLPIQVPNNQPNNDTSK